MTSKTIPAVRLVTAHTGASSSANELGMREMQVDRFSNPAIRPRLARVHIPSLNHTPAKRSTHSQTVSESRFLSRPDVNSPTQEQRETSRLAL
jgi:hypothetical protein